MRTQFDQYTDMQSGHHIWINIITNAVHKCLINFVMWKCWYGNQCVGMASLHGEDNLFAWRYNER